MNGRPLHPASVAAAALMLGGLLTVALPQHGMSIVRLVIVTVGTAAGVWALAVNAPPGSGSGWLGSPFTRGDRPVREQPGSEETARIRAKLAGRRQPTPNGPPLPPETVRLLQRLIQVALEREGLDPGGTAPLAALRDRLSPLTWAVMNAEAMDLPDWFRTRRPDERRVAEAVHHVLDDLERLGSGDHRGTSNPSIRGMT